MRLSTELAMEVYIQRVSSLDERMSQSNIIIFYAAVLLSRSPAKLLLNMVVDVVVRLRMRMRMRMRSRHDGPFFVCAFVRYDIFCLLLLKTRIKISWKLNESHILGHESGRTELGTDNLLGGYQKGWRADKAHFWIVQVYRGTAHPKHGLNPEF